MLVTFRITLEYVREDEDVIQFLNGLGNRLFLVLHEKPNNYHYHGLLEAHQNVKTFRKKLGDLLDPRVVPPKGFRPITVSDKIDDADDLMSYYLYRPGHPIKIQELPEGLDLENLRLISLTRAPKESKNKTKLDKDLSALLHRTEGLSELRDIASQVVGYYKELGRVVHIANMQQLIWSVYTYNENQADLIHHLLYTDEGLSEVASRQMTKKFGEQHRRETEYPE